MVFKRIVWACCAALLSPSLAHALGLGDIRLTSALNQPLEAEIDLINAAPDELATLKANLAARDTFARYGLDYPNFLSSVSLERGKAANGRDVLKVRSAETITEPFVSLLVEVNWGRGRLVREYTVLLDPPVFAPNTPRVAEAAPPSTASETAGTIVRPAPAEAPAAAPTSAPVDTYAVRRGDSLSGIARQLAGSTGASVDQMMVGLYRGNPEAFEGNMNLLRAGAILRVPADANLQAIAAGEAAGEVQRQYASWRGGAPVASNSGPGRLRLVAPGESTGGEPGGATADEVRGLRDRLSKLEGELSESKRLLELRNSELAALQKQLAARGGSTTTVTPQPAETAAPPPAASTTVPAPSETVPPAPEASPTPPAAGTETPTEVPPAAASAEPPAVAAPEPAQPMRTRVVEDAAPDSGPSILDTIVGAVRDYWYVLAALAALLVGVLGFRKFQDRRAANAAVAAAGTGFASADAPLPEPAYEAPRRGEVRGSDMVVEESSAHVPPTAVRANKELASAIPEADPSVTFSSDTAVNLDQGDPLAEADFHMAYGLYDQAAELVKSATVREPARLDLKLKLVEVFFVWGNKDEFLRLAKEIHDSGAARGTGDWEKIVIMGRQIAPEEPLFGQTGDGSFKSGSVDLDLAGGDNRVDFDVASEATSGNVDLDLGGSLGAAADAIDEMPDLPLSEPEPAVANLDVTLNRDPTINRDVTVNLMAGGGTTRQMAPEANTFDATDLDLELATSSEAPTIEQPALRSTASPTIREKIDAAKRMSPTVDDEVERTSEVAIDDLGLDIGEIEGVELRDDPSERSSESPTLVSGLDDESRRIMNEAMQRRETSATASLAALDGAAPSEVDFEIGEKTVETPSVAARANGKASDLTVDLNLDGPSNNSAAETLIANDVSLPPLEPVTMSEVGTKLDLARAYVDMGDPDGARNILQEVLNEGSMAQKQEAQRLLDSIPG